MSKAGTLITALLDFKRFFDDDLPLRQVLPEFVAARPQVYGDERLRDLCLRTSSGNSTPQAARSAIGTVRRGTHRIRSATASGWSPSSCAIRPTQPRMPNCRTVRLIASATASAVWVSVG